MLTFLNLINFPDCTEKLSFFIVVNDPGRCIGVAEFNQYCAVSMVEKMKGTRH